MVFVCCEGKLPVVSFVCHDVARDGTAVWYKESMYMYCRHTSASR